MTPPPPRISDADRSYIAAQLGREPRGIIAIATRDKIGHPSVITNQPLQWHDQTPVPFPTLYWLVDPDLIARISDLERRGAIGQIEAMIAEDPALREAVHADHRHYATIRWASLMREEQELATRYGFTKTLRDKGVGGTENFDAIKCLHMHAAYHLAMTALYRRHTAVGTILATHFDLALI